MAATVKTKELIAPKIPNDWEIEQKHKKEMIFAAGVVALAVLVAFGTLYHEALFSFLKSHMEISAIMLPSIASGFLIAFALDKMEQTNRKKLIVLAMLTFLAIAAGWSAISGFNNIKLASLCLGGGLILYFMFNAKEPFPELVKKGVKHIDPTSKFSYGNIVTADFEEVYFEVQDYRTFTYLEEGTLEVGRLLPFANDLGIIVEQIDKTNYKFLKMYGVKTNDPLPEMHEIVAFEQGGATYYGKVVRLDPKNKKFYILEHRKRIFSRSQKRALENGNNLHPLYLKDKVGEKRKIASYSWLGMIPKSALAACLDLVMIPFYILYLIGRLPYDIYKSQDGWELLGNRFFEILNVPGDAIESAATNAFCAVGSFFGCLGMCLEGFVHGRPLIFQKFLAKLEQIQNQVPLYSSYWLFPGRCAQFHFDASSDLKMTEDQKIHLKNYGAYILGCCQPQDMVEMDAEGNVIKITNIQNPELKYHILSKCPTKLELSSKEGWTNAPVRTFKEQS